ncbi:hypothetical protein GKC56_00250 [Neisseriaceae bacterium PsAf]|nr:hypothetical protein [Neisseriaceae bacterium PsAf]
MKFVYAKSPKERITQKTTDWASRFTSRMGIKTQLINFERATERNGLIISNHISWFDGITLRGILPTRHIAKKDVRKYPIIGDIGEKIDVIFISRENKADSPKRVKQVADALVAGDNVTLFPEGTTTEGKTILPFKVTFFESAIDANVPVIPLVIRYTNPDGSLNPEFGFPIGVGLIESAWKIAKQRNIVLEVNVLEPIQPANLDRIELANKAHAVMLNKFEAVNQASNANA